MTHGEAREAIVALQEGWQELYSVIRRELDSEMELKEVKISLEPQVLVVTLGKTESSMCVQKQIPLSPEVRETAIENLEEIVNIEEVDSFELYM